MGLVLDAGALIAFERGDRAAAALVEAARRRREPVTTSSGCVAQVWRGDGGRQVLLAGLLRGTREHALGPDTSRTIGSLCGMARTSDAVDAHVALLAGDGDMVLTSDGPDLQVLLQAIGTTALVQHC